MHFNLKKWIIQSWILDFKIRICFDFIWSYCAFFSHIYQTRLLSILYQMIYSLLKRQCIHLTKNHKLWNSIYFLYLLKIFIPPVSRHSFLWASTDCKIFLCVVRRWWLFFPTYKQICLFISVCYKRETRFTLSLHFALSTKLYFLEIILHQYTRSFGTFKVLWYLIIDFSICGFISLILVKVCFIFCNINNNDIF